MLQQQFSEEQVVQILELFEKGDPQYFYVASLRVLGNAPTTAREPFCLLAQVLPPPRIEEVWDEEARRRALHVLWLNNLFEEDRQRFLKDPVDSIFANDVLIDGELKAVTPEFVCRCVYYYSRFLFALETFPHAWCLTMQDYLSARWPEYKGQPVTMEVLEDWGLYRQREAEKDKPQVQKLFAYWRSRFKGRCAYYKFKWLMLKHRSKNKRN